MKAKFILFAFTLITSILLLVPQKIQAQEQKASGSSASFSSLTADKGADMRVDILRRYLQQYNSPLAPYAGTFVTQADLYHIDWRFVVAISGVESGFGKEVPCTNAWGWGIYTNHMYCFTSYDDAIRTISRDIRKKYIDQWGLQTVWDIGHTYAASPTWPAKVVYFMNDIQEFAMQENSNPLPISL